jgi:serine/threonine-protein kinase RsbT
MSDLVVDTNQRISVHNDLDIIVARLRAREIARTLGFNTIDQARISLAAGELARGLVKNIGQMGEIIISGVKTEEHLGIQVMGVSKFNTPTHMETKPLPARSHNDTLANVLQLVDEGFIEDEGEQETRVTLMKWLS